MLHRLGLTLDHLTHDAFEMVYTRSYLNELFVCSAGSTGITTLLTSVKTSAKTENCSSDLHWYSVHIWEINSSYLKVAESTFMAVTDEDITMSWYKKIL